MVALDLFVIWSDESELLKLVVYNIKHVLGCFNILFDAIFVIERIIFLCVGGFVTGECIIVWKGKGVSVHHRYRIVFNYIKQIENYVYNSQSHLSCLAQFRINLPEHVFQLFWKLFPIKSLLEIWIFLHVLAVFCVIDHHICSHQLFD